MKQEDCAKATLQLLTFMCVSELCVGRRVLCISFSGKKSGWHLLRKDFAAIAKYAQAWRRS